MIGALLFLEWGPAESSQSAEILGAQTALRTTKQRFAQATFLQGLGIFGPAEFAEGGHDAGQRKADHVEVAAFDAGNVASGVPLDGIGPGFVVRLFG